MISRPIAAGQGQRADAVLARPWFGHRPDQDRAVGSRLNQMPAAMSCCRCTSRRDVALVRLAERGTHRSRPDIQLRLPTPSWADGGRGPPGVLRLRLSELRIHDADLPPHPRWAPPLPRSSARCRASDALLRAIPLSRPSVLSRHLGTPAFALLPSVPCRSPRAASRRTYKGWGGHPSLTTLSLPCSLPFPLPNNRSPPPGPRPPPTPALVHLSAPSL